MHTVEKRLREIRQAISKLREAAAMDGDAQRAGVAQSLDELFGQVSTRKELRAATAQAMRLYRGGMGSFQDAGTPAMGDAVDGLRRALAKARSRLPAG
ncbi:hypothetical protein [Glutamicibacter nicotianae]|uniref:Uncharacterized protein n=1 Tax=Glutamicibacter nicotianae TaxID=37929 RepID=A0ABQ0RJS6_GLUNI|nr:hypothetical protein [Glutamicibacter nicotianae]GEC12058.1 hypothetical protein ANI01nite_12610 [Glutamicibacter nicotianae]